MSKFTKALEKIQDDKHTHLLIPEKEATAFSVAAAIAGEVTENQPSRWLRGVTEVKNAVPEHEIVTHHFANSVVAEQYRMLRVNIKTHLDKDHAKVILVSSSIHAEGKSVTAANLALSLAENADTKVVLVDADLRRGRIAEYLGFGSKRPGLADLLANTNGLAARKVMVRNTKENFVVIPRGSIRENPSGLISSTKFRILVEELRSLFDYVIIDSPPIMSVADSSILGRETDGVLMIIQVGRTPKSIIAHANNLFQQAGVKILGYVLTSVEYQSSDYRYDYAYRYAGYGENPDPKKRMSSRMKLAESDLHSLETRFTNWWKGKVLKQK